MDDVDRGSRPGATHDGRSPAGRGAAVAALLRVEPLEIVARELAVTAADLGSWRDGFVDS